MSTLLDTIKLDMTVSLKKGDRIRVGLLRLVISAVGNRAIEKYGAIGVESMTDTDVIDVVKKQTKTHQESIDAFTRAHRSDLVDKEQAELSVLEEYLPKMISDSELKELLTPVALSGETNFGLLMKAGMAAVGGQADGGRVSALLRELTEKNNTQSPILNIQHGIKNL